MNSPLAVAPDLADTTNRRARDHALAALTDYPVDVTGVVNYSSAGRLLIVGEDRPLVERAVTAAAPLHASALIVGRGHDAIEGRATWCSRREAVHLQGWLGDFRLRLLDHGDGESRFDLVLDLCPSPLMEHALPPPGYKAPGAHADGLEAALDALRALVGTFEKPRYFRYDPDRCAHGMKGATACRRCIDACPAGAIASLVERVEVEPHLCQGGGACATACPTGAMTYGYPTVEDSLERLRRMLIAYRESGGDAPVVLVHDATAGVARKDAILAEPGKRTGHLLPMAVEEVASLGLEAWFTALAYGARAVLLLGTPDIPEVSRRVVDEQLEFARAILGGLGLPEPALGWFDAGDDRAQAAMPDIQPARHAAIGDKRQILFAALDHLYAHGGRTKPLVTLPAGAPFGTAVVDEKSCTLCMACVTVCPAKALQHGQDVPQLRFREANCVQCGLCTRSCPEDAIRIAPRLLFDAKARNETRLLREDTPFHCVSCGDPFATASVIGRMQQRLSGHAMYRDSQTLQRLQMCGNCRVADMMRAQEL